MKKNSDNFSLEDVQRLAQSNAGKQLMDAIRHADSDQLRQAAALATQGNTDQAKQLLKDLINDPQIQQLLAQLGR